MNYLTAAYTDRGTRKKTNQDSVGIRVAETDRGRIALAALCDGVGGMTRGEVASAALVRAFFRWFEEDFPELLQNGICEQDIRRQWRALIRKMDGVIASYGERWHQCLGTTLTVLLLTEHHYYIANVGDSRIYTITDRVRQLTVDQTVVQREVDRGYMTRRQAETDPRRHILLQCVGTGALPSPDYYAGDFSAETVFLLCSDGFRHEITEEEMYRFLNPRILRSEEKMNRQAADLIRLNLDRGETDNITVGLIRPYLEGEGDA